MRRQRSELSRGRSRTRAALLALVVGCVLCAQASAQTAPGPRDLEARRDQLFTATLNDPDNLDVAFEYALVSAQLGDFEAAIATLERILVFAPNLPRVQLELGVLYYRIGANDLARAYLEAVSAQQLPPQVRERVNTYLAEVERNDRRLLVTGQVTGGMQYQTNANSAPGEDVIDINGTPVRLDQNARAAGDFSVFGLARVHFSYDLRNQGDLIEADVTTYNSLFADQHRLNLNIIEGQLGPSFSLGRIGFDKARIGVYGILGGTALDHTLYSTSYGAGLRFQTQLFDNLLYDSRHEVRAFNYDNSSNYPTVRLQTGVEYRSSQAVTALLSPQWTTSAQFASRYVDARVDYKTFAEYALQANASYRFFGPTTGLLADGVPWVLSLTAGGLFRDFEGPDPLFDEDEEDFAVWAEAGVSVPIEQNFSVFLTGQVRHQASNYDTRTYTNGIFTLGVTKRF